MKSVLEPSLWNLSRRDERRPCSLFPEPMVLRVASSAVLLSRRDVLPPDPDSASRPRCQRQSRPPTAPWVSPLNKGTPHRAPDRDVRHAAKSSDVSVGGRRLRSSRRGGEPRHKWALHG